MFLRITTFVIAFLLAQRICERTYPFAYQHTVVYFNLNKVDLNSTESGSQFAAIERPFDYKNPQANSLFRNVYFVFIFIWVLAGLNAIVDRIYTLIAKWLSTVDIKF